MFGHDVTPGPAGGTSAGGPVNNSRRQARATTGGQARADGEAGQARGDGEAPGVSQAPGSMRPPLGSQARGGSRAGSGSRTKRHARPASEPASARHRHRGAPRSPSCEVFAVREFSGLWYAQVLSSAGDQVAQIAVAIAVCRRTGSAFLTALAYAMSYLPQVVGGPLLGR